MFYAKRKCSVFFLISNFNTFVLFDIFINMSYITTKLPPRNTHKSAHIHITYGFVYRMGVPNSVRSLHLADQWSIRQCALARAGFPLCRMTSTIHMSNSPLTYSYIQHTCARSSLCDAQHNR